MDVNRRRGRPACRRHYRPPFLNGNHAFLPDAMFYIGSMAFRELGLNAPILEGVKAMGYTEPTPIQLRAIPLILGGQDVIGSAQTGTGKTAAFALPILQRL